MLGVGIVFAIFVGRSINVVRPTVGQDIVVGQARLVPIYHVGYVQGPSTIPARHVYHRLLCGSDDFLASLERNGQGVVFGTIYDRARVRVNVYKTPDVRPCRSFLTTLLGQGRRVIDKANGVCSYRHVSLVFRGRIVFL